MQLTYLAQTGASQPPILCLLKLPYFLPPSISPLSLGLSSYYKIIQTCKHLRGSHIVHLCIQPCFKTRHYTYHEGLLEPPSQEPSPSGLW